MQCTHTLGEVLCAFFFFVSQGKTKNPNPQTSRNNFSICTRLHYFNSELFTVHLASAVLYILTWLSRHFGS